VVRIVSDLKAGVRSRGRACIFDAA